MGSPSHAPITLLERLLETDNESLVLSDIAGRLA
jgi:hypothetical protein